MNVSAVTTNRPAMRWLAALPLMLVVAAAVAWAFAPDVRAGTVELTVGCGNGAVDAFAPSSAPGITASNGCAGGSALDISATGTAKAGAKASFHTTAPPGLRINSFSIPPADLGVQHVNDNHGYGGDFYWQNGHSNPILVSWDRYGAGGLSSQYLGWTMICGWKSCPAQNQYIDVFQIHVYATEDTGPNVIATTPLWYQRGWIRSTWLLGFTSRDSSGVCNERAFLGGQLLQGPVSQLNHTHWDQCASEPPFGANVRTSDYPNGALQLVLQAYNAAGVATTDAENLVVDNTPVSVNLSGPTDAPSTAGVQYVTAAATAGPAGVAGIECSVDGAPAQWYPGATASVPVQNLGRNTVTCSAANNARDSAGIPAWSTPATWTVSIRQPTEAAISFGTRIVNALRCRRAREWVRVPAAWVKVHRHGRVVKIRRRAHVKGVSVIRCHPRVARVRERVLVHGHWQWRWERRVLLPRTIQRTTTSARYSARVIVAGWLGTSSGVALDGQQVWILTAADNGRGAFRLVAIATTAADGSWHARLPAGPSRIVEAVYSGGSTTEPSSSRQIRMTVPASIRLVSIQTRHIRWGGEVTITGQLDGGYLPRGGELVDVLIGFAGGHAQIASAYVTGHGRFHAHYRFGSGNGSVSYPIWLRTAAAGDYPYAPARSGSITVTVG